MGVEAVLEILTSDNTNGVLSFTHFPFSPHRKLFIWNSVIGLCALCELRATFDTVRYIKYLKSCNFEKNKVGGKTSSNTKNLFSELFERRSYERFKIFTSLSFPNQSSQSLNYMLASSTDS